MTTHIPYTSQLFAESDQFVALCPELNVSSYGDSPEQALAALQEVVILFLEECQAMGTLETVLEGLSLFMKLTLRLRSGKSALEHNLNTKTVPLVTVER